MGRKLSKAGADRSWPQYDIKLPDAADLTQDREFCEVKLDGEWRRFRFHDYDEIYRIPGLYEQIFYRQLECASHVRLTTMLADTLEQFGEDPRDLRVLELGAGNGVVGERLRELGVGALAGLDISPVARDAALRDRPQTYDDYFVANLARLSGPQHAGIRQFAPNCLIAVACLGFGDMQPAAFKVAADMLPAGGWLALNVKYEVIGSEDRGSFGHMLREMAAHKKIAINSYSIYTHRMSVEGKRLHYAAMVGRKADASAPVSDVLPLVRSEVAA
ncbi:MAG: class I SAM-dependent methyltransferase [Planctomycetes bacterium]|nr:class I SAM-dependent methyltransferase [Planctomycetota bacterium]